MAQLSGGALTSVKGLVFLLCLGPLALTMLQLFSGGLGANPVEVMLHRSGSWGLRFLLITLAVTPLRRLSGQAWLVRLRRMLGLYAFFYALLHFTVFLVFEHSLDLASMLEDIGERPFILVGLASLLMLVPLAITSTKGWVRRLGRRWKRLHRLVYVVAALVLLHFFMLIKSEDYLEPLIYSLGLMALLLLRLPSGRRRSVP